MMFRECGTLRLTTLMVFETVSMNREGNGGQVE